MATLAITNPTLADWAKRLDPDGNVADIVEILEQSNPVLGYMAFREGNLPTGNRTTIRTGLPAPTWRKLYGGVQPARSTTAQVTDSTGMLEAYAEVDKALADLNGNAAAFRLSEDRAFIEGMSQELASTLVYGNEGTEPEAFTGLAPRFNSLSAGNALNVLNGSGTSGDCTSIWLVNWGENVHGIFPKGSKAGLSVNDLGEVTVENVDGSNGRAQMYRTHYKWDAGLTVRDWRDVVRIANVDMTDLLALSGTQAVSAATSVLRLMIQAVERVPNLGAGRPTFLVSRSVREMLRLAILDKTASNLTFETVAGKRVMTFDEIPVLRCDALLGTEVTVS